MYSNIFVLTFWGLFQNLDNFECSLNVTVQIFVLYYHFIYKKIHLYIPSYIMCKIVLALIKKKTDISSWLTPAVMSGMKRERPEAREPTEQEVSFRTTGSIGPGASERAHESMQPWEAMTQSEICAVQLRAAENSERVLFRTHYIKLTKPWIWRAIFCLFIYIYIYIYIYIWVADASMHHMVLQQTCRKKIL